MQERARVEAVHRDAEHRFSKPVVDEIVLLEGLGIEGDAHAGATVQHLSRVRRDPTEPNLRQVHLIHGELFDELAAKGYDVTPGCFGENVTTRGIDLLGLSRGTVLRLGAVAEVTITGLRNPCVQIDRYEKGLLKEVLRPQEDGGLERLAGIMGVVSVGGTVRPGDPIAVASPDGPHVPLETV
jgi:MOSC domain-containing protein YiiM